MSEVAVFYPAGNASWEWTRVQSSRVYPTKDLTYTVTGIPFDKVTVQKCTITYRITKIPSDSSCKGGLKIGSSYYDYAKTGTYQKKVANVTAEGKYSSLAQASIRFIDPIGSKTVTLKDMQLKVYYHYNYTACTPPTNVSLITTVTSKSTGIYWTAGGDGYQNTVTGYRIQQRTLSDTQEVVQDWADYKTTEQALATVYAPDTYGYYRQFRVQTMGTAGQQYYSEYAQSPLLRRNIPPTNPSNLSTLTPYETLTLSWTASESTTASISRYSVQVRYGNTSDGMTGTYHVADVQNGTSCTVSFPNDLSFIQRGWYVQFSVQAYDTKRDSSSVVYFNTIRRNTLPNAPTGLSSNATAYNGRLISEAARVTYTWNAATDEVGTVVGYKYKWSGAYTTDWAQTSSLTVTSPTDLAREKEITLHICSVDSSGECSSVATYGPVVRNAQPTKPAYLSVTPSVFIKNASVTISWGESTDATDYVAGYTVQYKTTGNWTTISVQNGGTWTPTSEQVPAGQSVSMRVYASDMFGVQSEASDTAVTKRNEDQSPVSVQVPITQSGVIHVPTANPYIRISIPQGMNGKSRSLSATVAQNTTVLRTGLTAESQYVVVQLPCTLAYGEQTSVQFTIKDVYGTQCTTNIAIMWDIDTTSVIRSIQPGSVISNTSTSHKTEMQNVFVLMNILRAMYVLPAKTHGTVQSHTAQEGYFSDWYDCWRDIHEGVKDIRTMLGLPSTQLNGSTGMYPKAQIINTVLDHIRTL